MFENTPVNKLEEKGEDSITVVGGGGLREVKTERKKTSSKTAPPCPGVGNTEGVFGGGQ